MPRVVYHANWADAEVPWQARRVLSWPSLAQRALPIAILTLSLVGVPILILEPRGLPRMQGLDKELSDVNTENVELRRDIAHMRAEVRALKDDPAAVERIAREQLGLVRKSEVVFQFGKPR
jgi:cell division protein FtsB